MRRALLATAVVVVAVAAAVGAAVGLRESHFIGADEATGRLDTVALRHADRALINQSIAALPIVYREVLVLRELEDLSYKDIARIADIPIGTVMSRLARARALMREALQPGARPVLRTVPRSPQAGVK